MSSVLINHTVTAAFVELGLYDHGGDEVRGLTCLLEEAGDFGGGGHVTILLEFLPQLGSRFPEHEGVAGESLARRSQHRSVCTQRFAPHSPSPRRRLLWISKTVMRFIAFELFNLI